MRRFPTLAPLAMLLLIPALGRSQAPEDRAATVKYLLAAEAPAGGAPKEPDSVTVEARGRGER